MMGSLYKHHGTWYVIVDVETGGGKRKQRWINTGAVNKKEAEKAMPRIVMAAQDDDLPDDDNLTVSQFLEKWLRMYAKTALRPNTYINYARQIRLHINPEIGRYKLVKLKPLQIQELYIQKREQGLSPASANYIHGILNEAFKHAVKWKLLTKNPCEAVEAPKRVRYHAQVYSPIQLQKLVSVIAGSRVELPVLIAVTCGLRRGEICALTWENIDIANNLMHVVHSLSRIARVLTRTAVKTDNSERTVKIPASMSQSLVIARNLQATRGFGRDEDFVVAWEDGRPMDPGYLYKTFQKLVIRYNEAVDASPTATEDEKTLAKLPVIRFHDLRHSHATLLLAQGVATKIVSERLGHSRTSFTQDTYQHVLPGMQDEAADLIDSALRKGK